jgi:hypothetical protein
MMGKRAEFFQSRRSIEVNIAESAEILTGELMPELIACPRQPGKLRISRNACGRRHLLASSKECKKPYSDFVVAFRWNLELCRNCPVGRMNAGVVSRKLSRHGN